MAEKKNEKKETKQEKEIVENDSKKKKTEKEKKTKKTSKEEIVSVENNEKALKNEEDENGIEISNDVVAVIAGVAVSEVQGVASMAGGFAGGISEVFSGKKNMAKGIKVEKTEQKVKIDVNIIVEYGTRIPDVAFEIQNRVKKSVESMTGFKVEEINVHVQGVNTEMINEQSKENSEEEKNEKENIEDKEEN